MEKGEFKPGAGGARVGPEDACGLVWGLLSTNGSTDVASERFVVQARPNCWRKEILGVGAV